MIVFLLIPAIRQESRRPDAADPSGPFRWPVVDGMVAVNGAGVLPLSPRDAVNHGLFRFIVGFLNAEPDPVSYPDARVERGAERHKKNHWRRSSAKSRGSDF
jgi:hypothetical protein